MPNLAYSFNGVSLTPVTIDNQVYFYSKHIANALGYTRSDLITKLYNANKDEFTLAMSRLTETTPNTVSVFPAQLQVRSRVFSLRGAHLIAMFSRTPIAKEFRKWVLDLIEKEIGQPSQVVAPPSPVEDAEPLPVGIYRNNSGRSPYRACYHAEGKNHHAGCYATVEEAILGRSEFIRKHRINKLIQDNADVIEPTLYALVVKNNKPEIVEIGDYALVDRPAAEHLINCAEECARSQMYLADAIRMRLNGKPRLRD